MSFFGFLGFRAQPLAGRRVLVSMRFLFLMVLSFLLAGLRVAAQGPTSVAEQYLFQAANAERVQRGLPVLRWDPALYRAATFHALEMAARESISHQYAGEADLAGRAGGAGARFSVVEENVAEAPDAVTVHRAWMESEGHRREFAGPGGEPGGHQRAQPEWGAVRGGGF